jgi:hypothetical protein
MGHTMIYFILFRECWYFSMLLLLDRQCLMDRVSYFEGLLSIIK